MQCREILLMETKLICLLRLLKMKWFKGPGSLFWIKTKNCRAISIPSQFFSADLWQALL